MTASLIDPATLFGLCGAVLVGVGFDTLERPLGGDEMGGYGLLSMAERAEIVGGRLHIRSRPLSSFREYWDSEA